MASKLAQAIACKQYYVTINSAYNKQWRDFTLQRGHVFGYSPELAAEGHTGLFVVHREMKNSILLYVAHQTRDCYIWTKHAIEKDSGTGTAVLAVLKRRRGGVEFIPLEQQSIDPLYHPPLTKCRYTPMPNMRIPGGSYATPTMEFHDYEGTHAHTDPLEIALTYKNNKRRRTA